MMAMETGRNRLDWDAALWSIVTILGAASFHVACPV
jgi:hypothetical protein